jgi:hypothetical protein
MGCVGLARRLVVVLFELDSALAHVLPQVVLPTLTALLGRMYVARFTPTAAAHTAAGQAWCARALSIHSEIIAYRQQMVQMLARLQAPPAPQPLSSTVAAAATPTTAAA